MYRVGGLVDQAGTECSVKKLGSRLGWGRGKAARPEHRPDTPGPADPDADSPAGASPSSGSYPSGSYPSGSHDAGSYDADGPEERARRGRWRLAVAGALFATLILPKVISSASYTDPALAQPSPSSSASEVPSYPSASPSSPSGAPSDLGLNGPSSVPSTPGSVLPSPPATAEADEGRVADAEAAAFRSVRSGQCLTVHGTGSGWSRTAPTAEVRVACGNDRAYVRVTAIRASRADCPDGNGRDVWAHSSGSRTTALCLTREYRVNQCLLAESSGGEMRASLMSSVDCDLREPTKPYNRVLGVTSVHGRTAGGTPGDLCAESGDDDTRYWTWQVDGGKHTLCAADRTHR